MRGTRSVNNYKCFLLEKFILYDIIVRVRLRSFCAQAALTVTLQSALIGWPGTSANKMLLRVKRHRRHGDVGNGRDPNIQSRPVADISRPGGERESINAFFNIRSGR